MRFGGVLLVGLMACGGSVEGPVLVDHVSDQDVGQSGDPDVVGPQDDGPSDQAGGDAAGAGDGDGDAHGSDPIVDTNPCTNGTAVFCDDFETATVGGAPRAPWHVLTNKGTATVASTQAYSGTKALKCTTTASTSDPSKFRQAFISIDEEDAPITGNNVYGRMMVWFGRVPPNDNLHWTNVRASGPVETETYQGSSYTAVYTYGGQYSHLMANYNSGDGPASDCWQHSDTILPAQTWECLEWQFDGPNQTMRMWLNGTPVNALTVVEEGQGCLEHDLGDRWVAPEFDAIAIGWEHYQVIDYDVEFYVDDVAFGASRLGCPQGP